MSDPAPRADDPNGHPPTVGDADHALAIEFEYAREQRARTVAGSVRIEAGEAPDDRSQAYVDRDGRVVVVDIAAADLTALRAGANTWFRLVGVAEAVADAAAGRTENGRTGPDGDDG